VPSEHFGNGIDFVPDVYAKEKLRQRKFLFALPYNSAPAGIRFDWSRLSKTVVFYVWRPHSRGPYVRSWHLTWLKAGNKCHICRRRTLRYRYCGGNRGCTNGSIGSI
jgi:hypothetical protein